MTISPPDMPGLTDSAPRMNADERRTCILAAAMPLFAAHGLRGTRIRDIASAAGVSEALLYKHFPSKEALHSELLSCQSFSPDSELAAIKALPPSSDQMAAMLAWFFACFISDNGLKVLGRAEDRIRLILNSLAGDGRHVRDLHAFILGDAASSVAACLQAAADAGELVARVLPMRLAVFLPEHLAFMISAMRISGCSASYDLPPHAVLEHALAFTLRGIGLTEATVERLMAPGSLVSNILAKNQEGP